MNNIQDLSELFCVQEDFCLIFWFTFHGMALDLFSLMFMIKIELKSQMFTRGSSTPGSKESVVEMVNDFFFNLNNGTIKRLHLVSTLINEFYYSISLS